MGAVFVAIDQPVFGDDLHLLQVITEQVSVEYLGLDESVLIRLARLEVSHRNALSIGPLGENLRDQLRPIVHSSSIRTAIAID